MLLGSYISPFGKDITAKEACYIPLTGHLASTEIVAKRWDALVAQDETSNTTAPDIEVELAG